MIYIYNFCLRPSKCLLRPHARPQILCLLPSGVVSWLALLGAGAVSGLFLLRNLADLVTTHARQHEAVILGSLGLIQLCFSLALKVFFYYK